MALAEAAEFTFLRVILIGGWQWLVGGQQFDDLVELLLGQVAAECQLEVALVLRREDNLPHACTFLR